MTQVFEVFPQAITLYPGDIQTFTARGNPPPPMWQGITSGRVDLANNLVLFPTTDPFVEGFSAHALYSGIGYADFTIADNNNLPTSTGYIQLQSTILTDSGTYGYLVQIKATQIDIYREGAVLLTTISTTAALGDVYRLELASGWRLYKNGVLQHSRTGLSGSVRYPMGYGIALVKPVVGSAPYIKAPVLTNDWRLFGIVSFTAPSVGTISTTGPAISTVYTTGATPGVYTLVAQISASADVNNIQRAVATITIPPLQIIGSDAITMQPGTKARFKTNYDDAQSALVTWAVQSGSGSFSGGEFTAPSSPGTTVVRATNSSNTSAAEITITTLATITAAIGSMSVAAAQASEAITLTTNLTGTVTWSASCGTISPGGAGTTKTWTAPSTTGQVCKVTATNGTLTKTVEIPVLQKFAYDPDAPLAWDRRRTVIVSQSEDRTRVTRIKDKDGIAFEAFEFTFSNRDLTELAAVHTFWDNHHPGKAFIMQDNLRSKRLVGYFDSDVRNEADGSCAVTYSFRFIQSNTSIL